MKSRKLPLIELLSKQYDDYTEKELYARIICGEVKAGDETVRDPRRKVDDGVLLTIISRKWVSRGGEKLDFAIREWGIPVGGKVVLDAGSSTGGFTDCLLQYGASRVYSVDVGYNQLDYGLRKDPRVTVMERVNIMSVNDLEPEPDFAVADLSFRSITGAAAHVLDITSGNLLIALIKPQFEIPATEGFDGIIRDRETLITTVTATADLLEKEGVEVESVLESPIKGGKGNTEFLFRLRTALPGESYSNISVLRKFFESR